MLGELPELEEPERQQLFGVVYRNVESVGGVLDNLAELSRIGAADARHQRHVTLGAAVAEAARQLREAAQKRGVEIRIAELPPIEVHAAAVELAVSNLLSNAIKYADPNKVQSWAEVTAALHEDEELHTGQIIVRVRDNGIGVPPHLRDQLFERFFRAHSQTRPAIEGTGLGLSIVRETLAAIGGKTWAEFPPNGSVFAFSLPCRRAQDRKALS
jgi:signal transduction histidine kinase